MKKTKKNLENCFKANFAVALLLAVATVTEIVQKDYVWASVLGAAFVFSVAILIIARSSFKKRMRKDILQCALDLEKEYKQQMDQWEQPMLLLAADASVCWENAAYLEMTGDESALGKRIDELNMGLEEEAARIDWQPITHELRLKDRDYMVTMRKVRIDEPVKIRRDDRDYSRIYSISFKDVTEINALKKENRELQPAVALIYADNYEQVFETIDESQKPLLQALLYRTINDLAEKLNGVLYQLEKSRFYLSFQQGYLPALLESNFHILEDIKTVENGNKYPLTLSIGVGLAHEIEEARRYAREAVDLALGRGGDQAVVKDKNAPSFYGGNSSQMETSNRVRPRQVAYALREEIEHVNRVIIMGHAHPDMDSIGSCLGLYRIATFLGKPAHIVLNDDHPGIDTFCRRLYAWPGSEQAIVDAAQAMSYCKNEEVLLIMTDCSRPGITQAPELLEVARHVAVIDHHRKSEDSLNPEICYIETYASSASELVTELLRYTSDKIELTDLESDALFGGIVLDTKYFTTKCGVRTFEAAASLRRQEADPDRVREFFKDDIESYQARGRIVGTSKVLSPGMLMSSWSGDAKNAEIIAAQAADEMLDIAGIFMSFVLTETEGAVKISARSSGNHNVQLIMEELGGGGHLNMAGVTLKETTLDEAEAKLAEAIAEVEKKRVK